ncbi:hypothetical protein EY918_20645 [Citrobacter braakii]|jgi:hypothetical protein|nr:hypothetical protein EY918_20645 [Citrobacter braakii]
MIRITKIPLKVVDIFLKALNDTTITQLAQGRRPTLKRLTVGKLKMRRENAGSRCKHRIRPGIDEMV